MGFWAFANFTQKRSTMSSNKIPWQKVFDDFKRRHPRLSKQVTYWCPHDYLTVLIYLNDGMKLTYSYLDHRATILGTNWLTDKGDI